MIIADLNHLEVVTTEPGIVGGGKYFFPFAKAVAGADAQAIGFITKTKTYTITGAAAGVAASSSSFSSSFAAGYP